MGVRAVELRELQDHSQSQRVFGQGIHPKRRLAPVAK